MIKIGSVKIKTDSHRLITFNLKDAQLSNKDISKNAIDNWGITTDSPNPATAKGEESNFIDSTLDDDADDSGVLAFDNAFKEVDIENQSVH